MYDYNYVDNFLSETQRSVSDAIERVTGTEAQVDVELSDEEIIITLNCAENETFINVYVYVGTSDGAILLELAKEARRFTENFIDEYFFWAYSGETFVEHFYRLVKTVHYFTTVHEGLINIVNRRGQEREPLKRFQ